MGCEPLAPFGAPQLVAGLDAKLAPADPSLSPDELTIYFTGTTPAGDRDLYLATRSSIELPFESAVSLTTLNSPADDASPAISPDGLTVIFQSRRIPNEGVHLYVATRTSTIAAFGTPAPVLGVASPVATSDDLQPVLAGDSGELWFVSSRLGTGDIFRAVRSGGSYMAPAPIAALNTTDATEAHPLASTDLLTVYFSSNRAASAARGGFDIYRAHRSTIDDGFGVPGLVPELETTGNDNAKWLSADGCRLYLHSTVSGALQIYVATRQPPL